MNVKKGGKCVLKGAKIEWISGDPERGGCADLMAGRGSWGDESAGGHRGT